MRSERSSIPTGSVPGMRLASAENALRAFPGGRRKGAVTNPGRRSSSGRRARLATSNPDTTDPRKKLRASAARAPRRMRAPCGGRSARLAQVAPGGGRQPDRQIRRLPAGNREPEGEEENASRDGRARDLRPLGWSRAQGRRPPTSGAAISDMSQAPSRPTVAMPAKAVSTATRSYHIAETPPMQPHVGASGRPPCPAGQA